MIIERNYFFDTVRNTLFGGKLTQDQVNGMNIILDCAEAGACSDDRHLAYVLATTFHETARTMEPIAEYGLGAGHSYGQPDPVTGQTYYGRGYVQLTWKENYQKIQDMLQVALVQNPDEAMNPPTAAQVIFRGMTEGTFTGVGLENFINSKMTDWRNARKIVNGLDCADQIADYAVKFSAAITRVDTTPVV